MESDTPYLRLSPVALRQFLSDRSAPIIDHIAATDRIPLEEAEKRLNGLREILGLLETIEITQRSTSDQFHMTLRIRTVAPAAEVTDAHSRSIVSVGLPLEGRMTSPTGDAELTTPARPRAVLTWLVLIALYILGAVQWAHFFNYGNLLILLHTTGRKSGSICKFSRMVYATVSSPSISSSQSITLSTFRRWPTMKTGKSHQ